MAWIETYNGAVNLDTVDELFVMQTGGQDTAIWSRGHGGVKEIFTADHKYRDRLIKVTHQIAQIARGNAYISQDDIRRMMDEILDK